jgi:uncharacterized membrane protein YkvA (DUF1232 family)
MQPPDNPPPGGSPPPGFLAESRADPFPREEFTVLLRRLPNYGRLALALARHPRLSRVRRAAVIAAAAYVLSPIDLVPGFIPVAGQLDDLLVAIAAIRFALEGLRPEFRAEVMANAGLTKEDLDADFHTTTGIGRWIGRTGIRATEAAGRVAVEVGREAFEVGRGVVGSGIGRLRRR